MDKILTREEVAEKYKWDLSKIYADNEAWQKDFDHLAENYGRLLGSKGRLHQAEVLADFLKIYVELMQKRDNLYVFANMKFFENTSNVQYQELKGRIEALEADINAKTVFIQKELSQLSLEQIGEMIQKMPALAEYKFFLETYARFQPHILSEEAETVLAELGVVLNKPDDIYHAYADTNIVFPPFEYQGQTINLTHGLYSKLLESPDRDLRRLVFENYYKPYRQNIDFLAETYSAQAIKNTKLAKIRKFNDSLHQSLFPDFLERPVFENLLAVAKGGVEAINEFHRLKKSELGLDELHFYDNYVSIVKDLDKSYSYEEAVELTRKAVEPLGAEYLKAYDHCLASKVIDVLESKSKRSGAFSWGTYLSQGYIFLNYTGKTRDLFTFAHELGHCLHRDFSIAAQPYLYYENPIFLAEIASTFNEAMLFDYLIKNSQSVAEKKFFIFQYMATIQATFFRQAMFANFEYDVHQQIEGGEIMTSGKLAEIYEANLKAYLGPEMVIDDTLKVEWSRIPHFYTPFYVFKYATSLSIAIALSQKVIGGEVGAAENYLKFLSSGSHKTPLEILRDAGIDLSDKKVYQEVINKFNDLLIQYKNLK